MKYLEYSLVRLIYAVFSIIPFWVLYGISDVLSILLQYVVRYRVNVVYDNLRNAFPEKSEAEIKKVQRQFYKDFCDNFLESIKGYATGTEQLTARYHLLNPEVEVRYFNEGRDIIVAMSHYANWEWGTQVGSSFFRHNVATFYKPMTNKYVDNYLRKLRKRRNMELLSVYEIHRLAHQNDDKPKAYFMVSDQSPGDAKKAYWTKFLNRETACIRGVETYAKLFRIPVVYLDVQKVKRGYYTIRLELLCDNPSETSSGEITELYMRKLEGIVRNKPEDWLWSHRRWKLNKHDDRQTA